MAKERAFSGVIAPVLTPFGDDGNPDAERFTRHARWLMAAGCTGLAPFGTTSEANSLGLDERMEMLEDLVDEDIDPARLMPGTGTCSIADTVVLTRHALDVGCGGMLMLPPFYYKGPSEDGLYRYFSEVIEEIGDAKLRIYLYHIPPVSQVGFPLTLIGRLVKAYPDTVVGLKDSSGDWSNTAAILAEYPQLEVFPGSEVFLLDGLRNGAAGCISATCNVNPGAIREVYDKWQTADAETLQGGITGFRKAIQAYPMIPALKALIAHYRDDAGWAEVRPPFTPLPAADAKKVVSTLAETHGFTIDFAQEA